MEGTSPVWSPTSILKTQLMKKSVATTPLEPFRKLLYATNQNVLEKPFVRECTWFPAN